MDHSEKMKLAQYIAKIASELTSEELQRALGFIEGILARRKIDEKDSA